MNNVNSFMTIKLVISIWFNRAYRHSEEKWWSPSYHSIIRYLQNFQEVVSNFQSKLTSLKWARFLGHIVRFLFTLLVIDSHMMLYFHCYLMSTKSWPFFITSFSMKMDKTSWTYSAPAYLDIFLWLIHSLRLSLSHSDSHGCNLFLILPKNTTI